VKYTSEWGREAEAQEGGQAWPEPAAIARRATTGQGLIVHFSAQPEPFSVTNSTHRLILSHKTCLC